MNNNFYYFPKEKLFTNGLSAGFHEQLLPNFIGISREGKNRSTLEITKFNNINSINPSKILDKKSFC